MPRYPCVAALVGFFLLAGAKWLTGAPAIDPKEIARLVEQLADNDFDKREAATRALAGIGEPAYD